MRQIENRFYCPKCGGSRWKTVIKGKLYKCRECGFVGIGLFKIDDPRVQKKRPKPEEIKLKWWQRFIKWIQSLWHKNS